MASQIAACICSEQFISIRKFCMQVCLIAEWHVDKTQSPSYLTFSDGFIILTRVKTSSDMEHLVFIPQGSKVVVVVSRDSTLATDWRRESDVIPFQPPLTRWLGFGHESSDVSSDLEISPGRCEWDYQEIWQGNLQNLMPP